MSEVFARCDGLQCGSDWEARALQGVIALRKAHSDAKPSAMSRSTFLPFDMTTGLRRPHGNSVGAGRAGLGAEDRADSIIASLTKWGAERKSGKLLTANNDCAVMT